MFDVWLRAQREKFFFDVFDILDFFDIFGFSLWGKEPGSGGPRNPGQGGSFKEPGARTGRDSSPVVLVNSKNP